MIPEGLKDQIELIVERWRDNDMDDEDLVNVLCRFVLLDRGTTHANNRLHAIRPSTPEQRAAQYARLRNDPDRWARKLSRGAARLRERREADPEGERARDRERQRKRFAADPEGVREKIRLKDQRWRAAYPEKQRVQSRRKGLRRVSPEYREKVTAEVAAAAKSFVPPKYPTHVRDDIVQAVVLEFTDGQFGRTEVKAAVKKAVSAYNRMFDTFKTKSLDAVMPGTDSLRLIDTIASDRGLA